MKSDTLDAASLRLRPIRLTDQISEVIKGQIFSGSLRPGDRVVEQAFARQLGVGQNAIREALIALAHAGFVRRVANKATYVTEITPAEGKKIARVRQALEGLVVDLILERLQTENVDFTPLENHLGRMRAFLKARDIAAFYEADIEFHRAMWRLSANQYLLQLLEQIVVPLFAFFIMVNLDPETHWNEIWEATEIHGEIVRALEKGSCEESRAALGTLLAASLHFSKPRKEARAAAPRKTRAKRTVT